ncbi:hypothetical protein SAMN05428642_1011336 [Flaviramulus basaltis]|uniref:Uncharacterized protein n=1 Tax=Flaviramulus basaltis TaxID=369401 RepID=A0A1K2IFE5_9FLAO|nr:hypothetical protein [Flaviramulus basaltis]SFZ91008.1 hypothetical protein SAMN05428642_1011336 [Flaviramulus basaltis]
MLLALLVLFSTVSFTVEKHYCGDILVDVSVFTDAEKCPMEHLEILQKKTCCKHEIDVVLGQNELKFSSFEDLVFSQQFFFTTFTYTFGDFFKSLPKKIIPHKDYSPPNLIADIQVLDQVFII